MGGFHLCIGVVLMLMVVGFARTDGAKRRSGSTVPQPEAVSPRLAGLSKRDCSFTIPLLFGIFVQTFGLTNSFYIIGALLLVPMLAAVPLALRNLSDKGTSLPQ